MTMDLEQTFREYSATKLEQNYGRIADCLGRLTEEQIWQRPGEASNSLGNLALHLAGNLRQWILHGVGGQPDVRVRDEEFAARGGPSREELLAGLREVVEQTNGVIRNAELAKQIHVQKYDITALEGIIHVLEHFSYHTGQIAFATKALLDVDLAFYGSLNKKEKPEAESVP
ncbi:MAG: DinB family protein [Acidobacteriota bacterium]